MATPLREDPPSEEVALEPASDASTHEQADTPAAVANLEPKSDARWRSITVTELCSEAAERPPLEYIVDPILPRGPFVHLWSGLPGAGKSYAAQSLALSVALGKPCWGQFPVRACAVVYVDLEGNRALSCLRFPPLLRGFGVPEVGRCHVIDGIDAMDVMTGDLGILADRLHEIEDRQGTKVEAMFFDSLSKMHLVDENTAQMAYVMAKVREFGEDQQVGLPLIHHNRKGGQFPSTAVESARGHTSIVASVDTHLVFTRAAGGIIRVEQAKNRLMPELEPFRLRIERDDKSGLVRVVFVEDPVRAMGVAFLAREFAVGYVGDHGWVRKTELVAEAERRGIRTRTLEDQLAALVRQGFIQRELKGKEAWFGPPGQDA